MSLQTRLLEVVQAIGADVKSLNTQMTTHTHSYLATNGKAADSNLLDGLDSTQFLRSDVNIDGGAP